MMRQAIPTVPRDGSAQGSWTSTSNGVVTASIARSLLVAAVRVFGMLEIPQRPPEGADRDGGEVVGRRRRAGGPLERPRVPRIVARLHPPPVRDQQVGHEDQNGDRLDERANRDEQVHRVPATA